MNSKVLRLETKVASISTLSHKDQHKSDKQCLEKEMEDVDKKKYLILVS